MTEPESSEPNGVEPGTAGPEGAGPGDGAARAAGTSRPAPGPGLPDDPFVRFDARVLDPTTAVRGADGVPPLPTAYVGNRLLLTAPNAARARELIDIVDRIARPLGLRVAEPNPLEEQDRTQDSGEHNRLARLLALAQATDTPLVFPIVLVPVAVEPAPAVDVWPLLQSLRALGDDELTAAVGLDHLMYSAAVIVGNPFGARATAIISGNPFGARATSLIAGNPFGARATSAAVESYLYAGSGGRGPVCLVMPEPGRQGAADQEAPGPRAVVLDTGVGVHPWFTSRPVQRLMSLSTGDHVGLDVGLLSVSETDPEGAGALPDPMTGLLASHAGHGTFIAGLLRQTCPDAELTVLRIMDADGVVPESTLTAAVLGLAVKLAEEPDSVDALVLSLGYYAETPEELNYTAGLKVLLLTIAARGVVTFAAAGNDSSQQRSYPAGFADDPGFAGLLPLVAVAALNPDGTVALFSNDGPWVAGAAPGANIVSTSPTVTNGAEQPAVELVGPDGRLRATIDPDGFSGGFSTWSGTSFAAPVLAGRFLQGLVDHSPGREVSARRSLVPVREM